MVAEYRQHAGPYLLPLHAILVKSSVGTINGDVLLDPTGLMNTSYERLQSGHMGALKHWDVVLWPTCTW